MVSNREFLERMADYAIKIDNFLKELTPKSRVTHDKFCDISRILDKIRKLSREILTATLLDDKESLSSLLADLIIYSHQANEIATELSVLLGDIKHATMEMSIPVFNLNYEFKKKLKKKEEG